MIVLLMGVGWGVFGGSTAGSWRIAGGVRGTVVVVVVGGEDDDV